jgi:hypothetical protein
MKKSTMQKSVRIIKVVAGFVWLACSFLAAMCFGMVSGLRGIGEGIQEYPYYWYAVVFSYILCSGILPAAYIFFGDKAKRSDAI